MLDDEKVVSTDEFWEVTRSAQQALTMEPDFLITPTRFGISTECIGELVTSIMHSQLKTHGRQGLLDPNEISELLAKTFLMGVVYARIELSK